MRGPRMSRLTPLIRATSYVKGIDDKIPDK
jgi:hypothetical protein